MMDQIDDDDLDSWRHHPITEAMVKAIFEKRRVGLEFLASEARSAESDTLLRVAAGRIRGYDEVMDIIRTKGKPEK